MKTKLMFRLQLGITLLLISTFCASLFSLFLPLNIETDMMSLLPEKNEQLVKKEAFDRVSKQISQNIVILAKSPTKEQSRQALDFFYNKVKNDLSIEKIIYKIPQNIASDPFTTYSPYTYKILSADYFNLLKNHQADLVKQSAIRTVYSPANISKFIKQDPFLLSYDFVTNLPFSQTSLLPYEDILVAKYDEKFYAFASISLTKRAISSMDLADKNINAIKNAILVTESKFSGIKILISGIPIHSVYASNLAKNEVNLIGIISIICTLLLVYFIFRSLRPFFFAVISITIGFTIAFATTHLIFGKIHMLTIIFGTALIGASIDYSLHFFAEFLNKTEDQNGQEILKKILPGITMGLVTTLFGYLALLLTPFPGLQQIALFSSVGLITSYLVVILIFPVFYRSQNGHKILSLKLPQRLTTFVQNNISRKVAYFIFLALTIFSVLGFAKINFNDDIRLLYSSPKNLIDNEILTRKILHQHTSTQFFLVTGGSQQEILEKEEFLAEKFKPLLAKGQLGSYQAISQFIPSFKKQDENYNLIKQGLLDKSLEEYAKNIGFNKVGIAAIKDHFKNQAGKFLTFDDLLKNSQMDILNNLWLGKINQEYASIVLLGNITNIPNVKALEQEDKGVYFLDKISDISGIFQKYRQTSFALLIAINLSIFALLLYRYGIIGAIFVFLPPFLAGSTTLAIMAFCGYDINLFNILALFLVLGLGIDYSIYYAETKKHLASTSLAVMLCCLTTLLSFGLLTLSSFPVIHSFGFTISIGIISSYLLAPLALLGKK